MDATSEDPNVPKIREFMAWTVGAAPVPGETPAESIDRFTELTLGWPGLGRIESITPRIETLADMPSVTGRFRFEDGSERTFARAIQRGAC